MKDNPKKAKYSTRKIAAFRDPEPKIVTELTPELAEKLWKQIQRKRYDDMVSKETVLHHLKQCKAHMGKVKKKVGYQNECTQNAINECMEIVSAKIKKIKEQ